MIVYSNLHSYSDKEETQFLRGFEWETSLEVNKTKSRGNVFPDL